VRHWQDRLIEKYFLIDLNKGGAVCVEVEDRALEGSPDDRKYCSQLAGNIFAGIYNFLKQKRNNQILN
jgi:hypothetical protein